MPGRTITSGGLERLIFNVEHLEMILVFYLIEQDVGLDIKMAYLYNMDI